MSCDRCTVWVTTKKEDWPRARDLIKESEGETPDDDLSDEGEGFEEWVYEDIRYPDELLSCLEKAGIPYRSVNSAGEYPEGLAVCIPGEASRVAMLYDGELQMEVNRETGEPDERSRENVMEVIRLEKKFLNYCKTGVL